MNKIGSSDSDESLNNRRISQKGSLKIGSPSRNTYLRKVMLKSDTRIPDNNVFRVGSQNTNLYIFNSSDLSLYNELLLTRGSADSALTTWLKIEDQMPKNN